MPLSEEAKQHKREYTAAYNKRTYKRVPLDLTHEQYAELKAAADNAGETVNGFIKKSVRERIDRLNDSE